MATPTYVGGTDSRANGWTGSSTPNVVYPGGVANGDLCVLVVESDNPNANIPGPAGWTQRLALSDGSSTKLYVYTQTYAGQAGFAYSTVPYSTQWAMAVYRGWSALAVGPTATRVMGAGYTGWELVVPGVTAGVVASLAVVAAGGTWEFGGTYGGGTAPPTFSGSAGWATAASVAPAGVVGGVEQGETAAIFHRAIAPGAASGAISLTPNSYDGHGGGEAGVALLITGVNQPPTAPTVTGPNGGETINNATVVAWSAGADPDGDPLTYELQFTRDNGATWVALASGIAATNYAWDTSGIAASTAMRVRVRAVDTSGATSAWDESNANFTVQHNYPPTPATGLTPAGNVTVDRTSPQRLAWTFGDPDGGDIQSKADVRWRVGTGAWTTITVTSPNAFYDAAAAYFPAGTIEWQVLTYDNGGLPATAWSASAFFVAAAPPAGVAITAPINGAVVNTSAGIVQWSAPAQESYQVRKVADNAGVADTTTVYYDSGEVVSAAARTAALTYPTNNRYEHVQVRVKVTGLWSSWVSVRVQVSYTPPTVPTLVVAPSGPNITVTITNPAPGAGVPAVDHNEVSRRPVGSLVATRIATNLPAGVYYDRSPQSGVAYEYQVRAVGTNGAISDSAWVA